MSIATPPAPPLNASNTAVRLGCSEWLVRKMISRGELRAIRLGRLVRVPEEAIAEKLAEWQRDAD